MGVGKSALHAAAEAGHEAVARLLVRADPQAIHARSEALAGRTPLQAAIHYTPSKAPLCLQLCIDIHYTPSSYIVEGVQCIAVRTPLQVARDADLAGLARRLEEYARECEKGAPGAS